MPKHLIQKKAPNFKAKAVRNGQIIDLKLSDIEGSIVLLFYPLDFTFVCPTELWAFSDSISEFQKRGATVLAVSVDSEHSHLAWQNTPKSQGGVEGLQLTMVSDLGRRISKRYGVLLKEEDVALRGLFIIDSAKKVRHATLNDLPLGRSVSEVLRTLDAIAHHAEFGEVCPVNWQAGDKAMTADADGIDSYFGQ